MSEEQNVSAQVTTRDGDSTGLEGQSELLDRLFKAFTRRLPDEPLSMRSNLAMVAYEEFYMWANDMTREEYEQAEETGSYLDLEN